MFEDLKEQYDLCDQQPPENNKARQRTIGDNWRTRNKILMHCKGGAQSLGMDYMRGEGGGGAMTRPRQGRLYYIAISVLYFVLYYLMQQDGESTDQ